MNFIIDNTTIDKVLQIEGVKELIHKIIETENEDLAETYCDSLDSLIMKEFNCEKVIYGEFSLPEGF